MASISPPCPPASAVCNVFEHEIGIAEYVLAAMLQHVVTLPPVMPASAPAAGPTARTGAAPFARSWPARPSAASATATSAARSAGAPGRSACGSWRSPAAPRAWSRPPTGRAGRTICDDLLEAADFVLIACPLTEATRGLIDRAEFEHMKPSALLINVARGPIVAEDALYDALSGRTIAGAVIDAWYHYPSADDPAPRPSRQPLHQLDNLIMTPHCSGWTEHLMARRFAVIIENLERLQSNRPLLNQVFPTVG